MKFGFLGFLSRLTVLNLELNHLTKLPVSFGKLKSLEEVDLSHNKLEHLPNTIGKLKYENYLFGVLEMIAIEKCV